ncbi:MAG: zinc-binding dehydrogenase [Burkholderiales bacterium]
MKSWSMHFDNGRATLEPREADKPQPKAGELLVRVKAASLNRGEFIPPAPGATTPPKASGNEAVGEVEAVGAGVSGFRAGDRVMGRASGGFAEFTIMNAIETMQVPASMSFEDAAAVPLVFLVTYDMLVAQGGLAKGEWLLVTGVTSGVGVACAQLAALLGAKTIGTSGSPQKLEKLDIALGIPTRKPDFAAQVLEATGGKGANLAVNNVGGTMFAECVKSLAYRGRLAIVGYMDGTFSASIDLEAVHSKRLKIFGVSNKLRPAAERAETVAGFARDVLPAFADGRIRPMIDRVFPMAEAPAALAYMESDAQVGKIVLAA